MPEENGDVIEIDSQDSLDLPTIEQLERELMQPTIENNAIELKSLELSKDSYGVSNDNVTIYNDQTSKYSRSRNNFNKTDFKKTPPSGLV